MKTLRRKYIPLLALAGGIVGFMIWLQPRYVFTGDSLNKLIQAESLLKSNFHSEQLFYPGLDIDPGYEFYPFTGVYHLILNGRHLGQYPVFFATVSAPFVALLGPTALPWISVFCAVLLLILLRRYWLADNFTIVFALLGTGVVIYAFHYSEVIYSVLAGFAGLTLILSSDRSMTRAFAGGLLAGIGIWLRLEGLIFFGALGLAWIIVRGIRSVWSSNLLPGAIAFGLVTAGFFAFNHWDYGHFLGPRYIANQPDAASSLAERFGQAVTLLFAGKCRPGFFVYTPLFLWALTAAATPGVYRKLDETTRILWLMSVIFLPLAALAAPNDGVTDWGARYLMLASLPCSVVLGRVLKTFEFENFKPSSWRKVAFYFFVGFSILVSVIGVLIFKTATLQLRLFQRDFSEAKADIHLFQNELLANHAGLGYFETPMVLARDITELQRLFVILRKTARGRSLAFIDMRVDEKLPSQWRSKTGPAQACGFDGKEIDKFFLTEAVRRDYLQALEKVCRFEQKKESKFTSTQICVIR